MNQVVKITRDEDGQFIPGAKWCYVFHTMGSDTALCSGQVFGSGEGAAEYEQRRGKITCPDCIEVIKEIKAIKL